MVVQVEQKRGQEAVPIGPFAVEDAAQQRGDLLIAAPPDARVYFVNLQDGATIPAKATLRFGLVNMGVAPAGIEKTNTGHHHHFFVEPDGELHDFPSDKVTIAGLPTPPKGTRLSRVDVIVRVRR